MEGTSPAIVSLTFATLVAIVGMPHGGLDHLFGRELFRPSWGRMWLVVFGIAYLGTAGLVLVGWFVAPTLTVVVFFLISAIHFGDDITAWQPNRTIDGGLVIWIPLLFRTDEVAQHLAWIMPDGDERRIRDSLQSVQPLLWAVCGFFLWSLISDRPGNRVRKLVFALFFILVPTLISFTIYFCGWHSTRELMSLSRRANPHYPWQGLRWVIIAAAPMAAIAVIATGITAWVFASDRELQPVIVQAVFLGLSVVAIPHILLQAAAKHGNANPFPTVVNES